MNRVAFCKASACTALAAILFAAAPAAQSNSLVVPPAYATTEGNTLDRGLGTDQIRHQQYIHTSLVNTALNKSIKELRYRRDGNINRVNGTIVEPMSRKPVRSTIPVPNWRVLMGNYSGDVMNPGPTYITNNTTLFTGVLNIGPQPGPNANMPDLALPASGLPPFDIRFPFGSPFALRGPHLIVEHFSNATRNATYHYYTDAVWSLPSGFGDVDLISQTTLGCPAGQNRVYGVAPGPGGGNFELYLFGAPNSARCAAVFGGNTKTWGGRTLPLNLGFMGLGACNIYTDLTGWIFTNTNLAGFAELRTPVPNNKSLAGIVFYNQWLVVDPRVNPAIGLAASDGVKVTLGTKMGSPIIPMSVLSGEGNYAQNRTGFTTRGTGNVFQLIW
ncbi:MAG: hypothetical protein ACYTKC_04050 [Planctomycetota bacterium]|jgi:hypothetical protein